MASVAATTTDLNCSVTFTILYLYNPRQTTKVTKVAPTACNTIPGYFASKMAEIPPINKPSNKA
ncbi:hypothetical protein D3C84_884920 [compost metagenome]